MRFEPRHAPNASLRDAGGFPALPPEIAFLRGFGVAEARLRAAAALARRDRVCAARALIVSGGLPDATYYEALAFELGVPFVSDWPDVGRIDDAAAAYRTGCIPLVGPGPRWLIAPEDGALQTLLYAHAVGLPPVAITTPARFASIVRRNAAASVQDVATEALPRLQPALSAKGVGNRTTGLVSLAALAVALAAFAAWPHPVGALVSLLFFAGLSFRLLVGAAGLANPSHDDRGAGLTNAELPTYSILVPLRDEVEILPQLLAALEAMVYPRTKLDVIFIVEPEDGATRAALAASNLPVWMRVVVAPDDRRLRTKPRALNIGLMVARGTLVTVYDAEDCPEPHQLRRAAEIFARSPDVDCLQARLAIDNGDRSWLSALFAVEYAALFDIVNVGMARWRLPIPLGGTSNHFQSAVVRDIGGWDAWNVTEDADLGLRLARFGHRVDCFAATTWEAAQSRPDLWMRQRRRWLKGWIQTFLVLMKDAPTCVRQFGAVRSLVVGMIFLNAVAGPILYPFLLALVGYGLIWSGVPKPEGSLRICESTIETSVLILGVVSPVWFGFVGLRARGLERFAYALPLLLPYQLMISLAAWLSLVDLIRRPYHWHKTAHRPEGAPTVATQAASAKGVQRASRTADRRRAFDGWFEGRNADQSFIARSAAAAANGAPAIAARLSAQRTRNGVENGTGLPRPAVAAETPKIRIGILSGKIRMAINRPPLRKPTVNAAPIAPSIVKAGVPTASEAVV
jgi:cellulose synthase/poly-beta-1,6-N-acetylglucosamine synthase-like glycosyltransferase